MNSLSEIEASSRVRDGRLLQELNYRLHEISQPMTVLLCTLEYGANLDSAEEMREVTRVSQEACDRLRKTVAAMQVVVREAIEEDPAKERVFG